MCILFNDRIDRITNFTVFPIKFQLESLISAFLERQKDFGRKLLHTTTSSSKFGVYRKFGHGTLA